jgi:hypothetical protein
MKHVMKLLALVLTLGGGCWLGQMPEPGVPSQPTPMRTFENGSYCLGNSNGVGNWHSSFCKSMQCEKKKCVAKCVGPATQDPVEGCQYSL